MITPPTRRIWLFAAPDRSLEIILLGSLGEIAWEFATILKSAEAWLGFRRVDPIAVGSTVLGMRCHMSVDATRDDPVAEGLAWLMSEGAFIGQIEWASADSPRAGRIGTW